MSDWVKLPSGKRVNLDLCNQAIEGEAGATITHRIGGGLTQEEEDAVLAAIDVRIAEADLGRGQPTGEYHELCLLGIQAANLLSAMAAKALADDAAVCVALARRLRAASSKGIL